MWTAASSSNHEITQHHLLWHNIRVKSSPTSLHLVLPLKWFLDGGWSDTSDSAWRILLRFSPNPTSFVWIQRNNTGECRGPRNGVIMSRELLFRNLVTSTISSRLALQNSQYSLQKILSPSPYPFQAGKEKYDTVPTKDVKYWNNKKVAFSSYSPWTLTQSWD